MLLWCVCWLTCKCSENCPRAKRLALRTTWSLSERLWHTVCSIDDSILTQIQTERWICSTDTKNMAPQRKIDWFLKNGTFSMSTGHTWCVCGQHILQPAQQDTWHPPSSDTGFHWQGRPEWGASKTQDTTEYTVKKLVPESGPLCHAVLKIHQGLNEKLQKKVCLNITDLLLFRLSI